MDAMPARGAVKQAVLVDNVLGKGTGAARRLALSRLNTLYGILTPLESIRIPGVSGDGRPESVNLTG
jgi:hypothetical protein